MMSIGHPRRPFRIPPETWKQVSEVDNCERGANVGQIEGWRKRELSYHLITHVAESASRTSILKRGYSRTRSRRHALRPAFA